MPVTALKFRITIAFTGLYCFTTSLPIPGLYPATVDDKGVIADLLTRVPGIVVVYCLGVYPVEIPEMVVAGANPFTPIFTPDNPTVVVPTFTLSVSTSPNGISTPFGAVYRSLKLSL